MSRILEVKELTGAIKGVLEGNFPFVWVQGEVSNLSRPASGHIYFSLKDEQASIAAVWFKGSQQQGDSFDPLTGEVYEDGPKPSLAESLENGQEVVCAGRITVYPPRGNYQLLVELMQEAGKGRLQLEFELLRAELAKKGYFDEGRKRPLPAQPRRVAVVTSPSGAAIHDFLRIAQGRGLGAEIRIHPVLVQGDDAPPQIAAAIRRACSEGWAEVVVLIRGGGSLEDLWAFNTKPVVEAIFESSLPVLSGVGHEVDFTLSDYVADKRAATPSHAAQMLWVERRELVQLVDELEQGLGALLEHRLNRAESALGGLERVLGLLSPAGRLERSAVELDNLVGRFSRTLPQRLAKAEGAFDSVWHRLLGGLPQGLEARSHRLDILAERLSGLNPELPLQRGYAFVKRSDGSILRSSAEAMAGEMLALHLVDGQVPVVVSEMIKTQKK
ncbi:exodeoxyribonuclease VII large subunit [Desulfovibrio sp. OttesenSCG-928-C06]|nr:exodeoxyribonuclease VII large subunit [Desulfovibrio sp. OttesenSCG-928-C06]